MTKLWILLAVTLLIAWRIDKRDHALQRRETDRQERGMTWLLILVLGMFCGLRTWGNDTTTYLEVYEYLTPTLGEITAENRPVFSDGIGFFYVSSLLKTLGVSNQNYLLFFAFATVIPYVLFLRHHSRSMVFAVFLLFTTGCYTFTLAAIKQCQAIGLCLLAVEAALEKKWLRFFLLVGVAMLFHPYALVYLLVPLLMFRPWTFRTVVYVAVFVAAGFLLDNLLGVLLDVTGMMGATYNEETFAGEGVNVFRVAVSLVPMILACLCGKKLFRSAGREECLVFNMAMINGLIMFVGLFGTANYFARLANYFLPAQIIVLPWILSRLVPKDRLILKTACILGYLGYFIYENAMIRPFDTSYTHIGVWSYLVSLF